MARQHRRRVRRLRLVAATLAGVVSSVAVAAAYGFDFDSDVDRSGVAVLAPVSPGAHATVINVGARPISPAVKPGFLGVSLEYTTVETYAGTRASALDPVLVHLLRGLAPGQKPVLRIGGDSTDWAWWPIPHVRRPLGVRIAIGPRFASVLGGLARASNSRVILGINLEADSRRLAAVEAGRLVRIVGPGRVLALELGNEPELYGTWPWRVLPGGRAVIGRASDYGMAAYARDFRSIATGLPGLALAGPALGGPLWIGRLGEFVRAEPRLGLVTLHTYPLQRCDTPLVRPTYPTIPHLLALRSSRGLAERLAPAVHTAHARGLPLRVDEINNVSCSGRWGISNTFASALWAVDAMFALARVGVDGVNIHTLQNAAYALFRVRRRHGRWEASVAPEYYGLLLFARAAPPGSRLLNVTGGGRTLRAWATTGQDRTTRIVLINQAAHARVVLVRVPDPARLAGYQALRAASLRSTGYVSIGGASFGPLTATGMLPPPRRILVRSRRGAYALRLPAGSAVMLTVPGAPTG